MIRSIGFSKILVILLLVIFIFLSFLYAFQYLKPDLRKKTSLLAVNRGEIAEMTDNLNQLTDGLEKFESQKGDFQSLRELGFFDPQNRVSAKQRITEMQRDSKLLSAKYSIKPAVSVRDKKLREAGHKILKTDITFDLEAIEDADVYKFIYMLNYGFPGQVIINSFSISREVDVTQPLLRKIGVGQSDAIIKANLKATWKTMVPDETISVRDENNQDGGM